jgi:pimeloyl-ACP methyl ester carboxylesterase
MTIQYDPITAPDRWATLQELRLPVDTLAWTPSWAALRRRPTATPRTVMLLPGFGASHRSLGVLGGYLRRIGHHAYDWGLGRNTGNVPELLEGLRVRLETLVDQSGGPASLVGWSLGGYLAREIARDHPELVRKVITLGSPVIGGPRFTATARWYQAQGVALDEIERIVAERFRVPIRVPVVAIYSKRDGIVAWQACIDRWSPDVRHIEVSETHIGLGFAPKVLGIVAEELDSC